MEDVNCICNQDKNISEINAKIDHATAKIDKSHDTVISMETTIKDLVKEIKGNGQPGLVTKHNKLEMLVEKYITANETRIKTIAEEYERRHRDAKLWIGGSGILGAIAVVINIVTLFMR